ncbi:MAG TPA: glycosyltransferase family 2 protein [Ramlibacter sp.]|nr:glycosyltransferase family 2 protein [Ramlibacter sp.]
MTTTNHDVWIIIPVYNEAGVIRDVVNEVMKTFPNVVCIDDGSRDDSSGQVLQTDAHLLRHPINMGQGAGLQTGLRYALARKGAEYFVTFDADGQHRVEDALAMVEAVRAGQADVALGSRFLDAKAEVPLIRRIVLGAVARLSPTSRKLRLTDAHNGLRVFNRKAASTLKITNNGMAHASELIAKLAHSSLRVKEMPVTILYTDYSRAKGQSLLNGVNILFDLSMTKRDA